MKKLSILFLICSIIFAQDSIEALIQEGDSPKTPMQETLQDDPLGELNIPSSQEQNDVDMLIQESSPNASSPLNPQEREELDLPIQENNKQKDDEENLEKLNTQNIESKQEAPQEIQDEAPQKPQIPQDLQPKEENLVSDENKMNPKFFDYNKNHQKEELRALSAEEIRKKSNQCEDLQDKKVCFEVGMAYYQGRSVYGQNLKQALYFLDRSCDGQNGLGCYEAGIISAKNQAYQYSFIFLEKSCQSGDLRGCKNLGILYYNGQGTPKNIYRATEIFKMGCNKGDKLACQKLYLAIGNAYQDALNYNGARKNFQQACDLGEAQACQKIQVIDMLQKQAIQEQMRQRNKRR